MRVTTDIVIFVRDLPCTSIGHSLLHCAGVLEIYLPTPWTRVHRLSWQSGCIIAPHLCSGFVPAFLEC